MACGSFGVMKISSFFLLSTAIVGENAMDMQKRCGYICHG